MEVYSYEGKKANEVFEKALSDLNVTEDEILYHKQINKGGFLKSDTVKFTIVKLTEVQNAIKSFLEETINNMGLEVKFETNIKDKQITHIERLAKNLAREVKNTKQEIVMENMNSYERRIVHNCLTNMKGITTISEGEEPNRHVIIKPTED